MKPYPDWVFGIIILLSSVPVISIPLVAVYKLIRRRLTKSADHTDQSLYYNDGSVVQTKVQANQKD